MWQVIMTCHIFTGAAGRSRTGTVSLPADFESATSANSITAAKNLLINYSIKNMICQEKIFLGTFDTKNGKKIKKN